MFIITSISFDWDVRVLAISGIFFASKKFGDLGIGPPHPQTPNFELGNKNVRGPQKPFKDLGKEHHFSEISEIPMGHQNYKEVLKCTV